MEKVRYEEMMPHEIAAARKEKPVAYLPIGGIEWHGEHNPVGLDTVKAHELCIRAAQKGGGLAMPALFWGESRESGLMEANHDPDGKIAEKMGLPQENFAPGYMGGVTVQEEHDFYDKLLIPVAKRRGEAIFSCILPTEKPGVSGVFCIVRALSAQWICKKDGATVHGEKS